MPSIAVLIAAVQTIATPGSRWATGLSIANAAVMMTLIALVWRSRNPSQIWVQARTRAELLRREQYLCLAAIGPYQGVPAALLDDVAAARIALITKVKDDAVHRLIPMRGADGLSRWHDEIWTRPNPPLDAVLHRARSYLHYRIGKQVMWFSLGEDVNRGAEGRIAAIIKGALLAAVASTILLTALHAYKLAGAQPVTDIATILTLVLPPSCAFLLAIQELYSHRRLAASYKHTLGQLIGEYSGLAAVVDRPAADPEAVSRQFQSVVVHTEAALTDELQRWRMLIQRDEFDLSL
jgi:hypothetical protein